MTGRQWRLMVNGEAVDAEDGSAGAPASPAPARARRVSRMSAARWLIPGGAAAFEVLLAVALLALVGPGWEAAALAISALALLLLGVVVNR